MAEFVRSDLHDGYTEIALNRPERRNALIEPLGAELRDAIRAAGAPDAPAVILLRGEGGAFCSGLDLKALNADPPPRPGGRARAKRCANCTLPCSNARR